MTTQNANSDSWTLKNFKKFPPKHFIEKLILPNSENLSTIQQSHHHLQDALDVGPTFVQVCKCVTGSDISLCKSSCNHFLVHKLRFFEIFFPKKTRCLIFHIICLRTQYVQCTSAISNSQDSNNNTTANARSSRSEVFCNKRSSQKFCKIHMKVPVSETRF